jgi:hypothetical protein
MWTVVAGRTPRRSPPAGQSRLQQPSLDHTVSALFARLDRYIERLFEILEKGKSVTTLKG